jgi:hypothetical protein
LRQCFRASRNRCRKISTQVLDVACLTNGFDDGQYKANRIKTIHYSHLRKVVPLVS